MDKLEKYRNAIKNIVSGYYDKKRRCIMAV